MKWKDAIQGKDPAGWGLKAVLFAVAGFWIALSYYLPQAIGAEQRVFMVPFVWENHIPFQPWWTLVYQSIFIVLPVFYLMLGKKKDVWVVALGLMATALIDGFFFLVYPTAIQRPPLPDGLGGWIYEWLVVRLDGPVNLIPSQHAAMAVVACMAGFRLSRHSWLKPFSLCWLVFLLYSTLAVKQHVALDLLPGCAVGLLAFWAADWAIGRIKDPATPDLEESGAASLADSD